MSNPFSERESSRRDFLASCVRSVAGLAIVGVVSPILASCDAGSSLTGVDSNYQGTFSVSSLTADGTALKTTTNGGDGFPILIVRNSATSFTALSMQCTHEACMVNTPSGGTIVCTCHGSQFDLAGNVKKGPANSALYKYATTYDATANTITVKPA